MDEEFVRTEMLLRFMRCLRDEGFGEAHITRICAGLQAPQAPIELPIQSLYTPSLMEFE